MREKTYSIEQFRYMMDKARFKEEMKQMRNRAIQSVIDRKRVSKKDILCCLTPLGFGSMALKDLALSDNAVIGLRRLCDMGKSKEIVSAFNQFSTTIVASASATSIPVMDSAMGKVVSAGSLVGEIKKDNFIIAFLREVWEWASGLPTAFLDGLQSGVGIWADKKLLALRSFFLDYGMQVFTIAYVCYCAYIAFKMMFDIGDAREKNHLFAWTVVLIVIKLLWKFVFVAG